MAANSFEKTNINWQIQQLQQQIGEWWELQTKRLLQNSDLPLSSLDWINFALLWQITKIILIILVCALVISAGWQIWQLLSPSVDRLRNSTIEGTANKREIPLSIADWLRRSQIFQQQGDYYQAFQCLYLAMLQQLSDRNIVPYQGSRTDGEYLQIIQQLPRPQPYQFLLMTHQQLCFGHGQASLDLLQESQQAYREIDLNYEY